MFFFFELVFRYTAVNRIMGTPGKNISVYPFDILSFFLNSNLSVK